MGTEVKISKKKRNIILIIVAVLLVLLALFLFWFFNRKFDVTFKVNDNDTYKIQVKYNQMIKEEDVKKQEELGEDFIDWYEVLSTENDKEVLAEESFDFTTKIKTAKTLRAVYKEKPKTITITFDSKGGSKVNNVVINLGEELNLPKNPTRNGYTFVAWNLKNGTPVYNKAKFDEDVTLYANWKKNEEQISLSLSRSIIHRNGNNTSKATAKVQNSTGKVTYTIDDADCVSIDKNTGALTARETITGSSAKIKAWLNKCAVNGKVVTVTATLPSGKSASAKLTLEKDLELYASNSSIKRGVTITANGKVLPADKEKFYVDANQTVTWSAKADDAYGTCTAVNKTQKSTSYEGNLGAQCTDGNYRNTLITATTPANQKITIKYYRTVN